MNAANQPVRWWALAKEGDSVTSHIFGLRYVIPQQEPILVVDDDPDQLRILHALIAHAGYAVTSTESVPQALELLKDRPFRAIVTDFKMPAMDGFQFINAARSLEGPWPLRDIPVIMLTSCDDDMELSALEKGADMFCEKFRAGHQLVKQIQFLLEM